MYYLAPPPPPRVYELGSPLLPPASHSTFSAHKVSNSHPWLRLNILDDIWTPILNSFIHPLFCGLPNYFFVMICCGKKNNTLALVIVAEYLLLAYISMSHRIYVLELTPHWSNSTWGCGGLGCETVKELIAMNGVGLALSGGHSNKSPLWIVKGQVLLDPEPSRIFSVLCLGPGRIIFYFFINYPGTDTDDWFLLLLLLF